MDRFRGLGGARKRGASGASMGSVLSLRTSHRPRGRPFPRGWTWIAMAVPTTCELCIGRQNPPARPRACSTPARNGAAEPRASPLYIGRRGGASPLMRATVLLISPTPSARTLPRSRAKSPVAAEGTPLRGSIFYWSVEAIMS